MGDPRITEYVETKIQPTERAEARELPLRFAKVRTDFNMAGAFQSGMRMRAEDEVHLASLRLRALARTKIQIQAHRSYGVAIEDADIEELSRTIATMITKELAERAGV